MARRIDRHEWQYRNRPCVIVDFSDKGGPEITVKLGRDQVMGADRERAAAWLVELLAPMKRLNPMSHEACYQLLWGLAR